MEHLNLSLPLHVQVPPLPSPNTTAAAAALFRVNQLPSSMSPSDPHGAFGFKSPSAVALKKRQRLVNDGLGIYAPSGGPSTPSLPTPTTAAAAAAAMALSAASPASANSMEQYEQKQRAMLLAATSAPSAAATSTVSTATASEPADANSSEMRRRKVGIPKFLRYLFQMLEYEDHAVIAWSHDGSAFQIRDPDELAERILPKYFKHNKVSSFQRQLNYFGFKKWTKTQTNICTFSHPFFNRAEQDKMRLIKRKERSTRGSKDKTTGGGHDGDDDDGEDDESDDHEKPPPAKRAKASTPKAQKQRPISTSPPAAAGAVARSGRATTKKEPKPKVAKPPRSVKKSPQRGRHTVDEYASHHHQYEQESAADDRPASSGPRGRKTQVPTISPASAMSSSGSSSLNRLLPQSASTSPTSQAALYSRGGGGSTGNDAAPVMPVHSEMMVQQANANNASNASNANNAFLRRFQNGPYDNGGLASLPDLTEAFASGQGGGSWQASTHPDTVSYGIAPFKFNDPSAFDMGTNGAYANANGGPNSANGVGSMPNAKDYLDVLLESANMDEQLAAQAAASANDSSMASAWEASYQQQAYAQQSREQAQAQADRRMAAEEAAMATFNMLSASQAHGGGQGNVMQLPSIEDLQGAGRY